jgi:hypothetical protein
MIFRQQSGITNQMPLTRHMNECQAAFSSLWKHYTMGISSVVMCDVAVVAFW